MLMIRPRFRRFIAGSTARESRNGLLMKKSSIDWKNAQSYSSSGLCGWSQVALRTRMSTSPAAATSFATSFSSVTSAFTIVEPGISAATAFPRFSSIPLSVTRAPAFARAAAIARPSPRVLPVTSARRPSRENMGVSSRNHKSYCPIYGAPGHHKLDSTIYGFLAQRGAVDVQNLHVVDAAGLAAPVGPDELLVPRDLEELDLVGAARAVAADHRVAVRQALDPAGVLEQRRGEVVVRQQPRDRAVRGELGDAIA